MTESKTVRTKHFASPALPEPIRATPSEFALELAADSFG